MAQSRVERFKEYRKSIINDDNAISKTTIETDVKVTAPVDGSPISEQEALFLKKIYQKEKIVNWLYIGSSLAIVITLVIFGFIIFLGGE